VYTALAAIGAALCCGMPLEKAVERLRLIERQAGRLNPLPGANGSVILDDTYNASPLSMHAALDTLHDLPARRRIAVLGDMLELGEAAPRLHAEIGQHAAAVTDLLVTKGDLAALTARDAHAAPTPNPQPLAPIVTHTAADAIAAARATVRPGDVVLIKGSAEARMEAVVAGLLAPHVDPATTLVRQERAFRTVRVTAGERPTWLEIDLQAIATNTRIIKQLVGPHVQVMVTLKADAYGHGAVRVARTVLGHGASSLAVATLGEAVALRDAGIDAPILILGYTPPWQVRDAVRRDIQIAVFDHDVAHEASAAAEELQRAAVVHVKIDTGMARLGVLPPDAIPLLGLLRELPGVRVEGLFTHFATADSADECYARRQLAQFCSVVHTAAAEALRPPLIHAANSAATLRFPQAHFDLVRPGLAIYGLAPSSTTPLLPDMRPALSFKTQVAQVKAWPAGQPVSYGGTWVTQRPSRIATLPLGYADGFRRNPHWQYVLVRGQRAPVVGRVAMDYTMIDVTDIAGVQGGDEVILIGQQGDETIGADLVAAWLNTNSYEVVSTILPRVPRIV
jgi:alanine racemase